MPENNSSLTEAVYYTLLSLTGQMHGYGVIQNVKKLTGGRLILAPGTLYGVLTSLMQKNWICPVDSPEDSRKKEYIITPAGLQVLKREIGRLEELAENGRKYLRDLGDEI